MPSMFSRRRGSSVTPPASHSTMSAATVAASQAYINKASSASSSLSSAAAAAALRSHTTTPEPVGNLQTKRMMRRGSVTSVTSNGTSAIAGRPGLQRSNSSGSMTERTFRSSSRSPSRNGASSPAINAPPVPPMPKTLRNGQRRAGSIEPPQRVISPPPVNSRRSASVDKINTIASSSARSTMPQVPEIDTQTSTQERRASVNFSRPRVGSPSPTRSPVQDTTKKSGWFGGPTGTTADAGSASIQQVMDTKAKSGMRKPVPAPVQTTAPVQEMEYTMVFDAASRTFVRKARPKPLPMEPPSPIVDTAPKLKPGDFDPATRSIVPFPVSAQPATSAQAKHVNHTPSPRPGTLLHKQPSMVREDYEAEREAEADAPKQTPRAVSSSQGQAPAPAKAYTPMSHQRSASLDVPQSGSDRNRGGSLSPSRSARFSATPIIDSTRHEPHRGVSPAKSALKHSPSSSIRTASPTATFSPPALPHSAASDISDATSLTSADGSAIAKKRRSVRVSFDDEAAKAEPVPPIPVAKTITTRPALSDDEQDEIMQPRPDLPSFGSIRRNKAQNDASPETLPNHAKGGLDALFKKQDEPISSEATSKVVAPAEDVHEAEAVPAINLHPPTPAIDDKEGFTDDENNHMSDSQELRGLASGLIFYGDESDDSRSRRLTQEKPVFTRKDSDADEYADAQETQDGTAQPGFASLDAIVESPMASPVRDKAPGDALTTLSDSPSKSGTHSDPDWSAASAHWSSISKQQKAQHELGQLSSDDEVKTKRSFFKRNKKSKEQPVVAAAPLTDTKPPSPPLVQAAAPVKSVPSPTSQPLKPALKKSTMPANDDSHHLPRTMRGNDAAPKKTRPASTQITGSPIKAVKPVRPASAQFDSFDSVSGQRQPREPAPIQSSSLTANKLSKKFQDDSDSESSFRKKKRSGSAVSSDGRYTMKRSMRAGSVDSSQRMTSPTPSGRARTGSFLRSMSPSSVTSDRPSMRMSLRGGPPDAGARTLRGSQNNIRPTSSSMTSRLKSRLVDSDDEDDRTAVRPTYRSRFVDSDDEDKNNTIPEELTPVRGIPRRKGQQDGDSTDLDEESDTASPKKKANKGIVTDEAAIERAMEAARRKLGIAEPTSAKTEDSTLRQGTMRDRENDKVLMSDLMSETGSNADPTKKKRGFMGSLLRRNKGSSQSTAQLETPTRSTITTPPTKTATLDDMPASPSSAKLTRRLSNQPPKLQRGYSSLSTATAPAAHGRADNEHWPLPPPIPTDRFSIFSGRTTGRPQTSDEASQSKRPAERPEARRSFSARVGFTDDAIAHSERDESVAGANGEVYSRRTGKKKKFALLRRAFGLYD